MDPAEIPGAGIPEISLMKLNHKKILLHLQKDFYLFFRQLTVGLVHECTKSIKLTKTFYRNTTESVMITARIAATIKVSWIFSSWNRE